MARISKKERLANVHYEAMKRFDEATSADRDQRNKALQDLRFAQCEDGQWEDNATETRRDRPRYTINKVASAVDKLKGRMRQTRQEAKIMPSGNNANKDTAGVYEGLIKNIEVQSDADDAYDNGFDYAVNGGMGAWRVMYDYVDDESFDQELKIRRIKNPLTSVWFDPGAIHYDKRDAMYCFVVEDLTRTEYERRYPDYPVASFPEPSLNQSFHTGWASSEFVRVAEYWRKVPYQKTIAIITDGNEEKSIEWTKKTKMVEDELLESGWQVVRKRECKAYRVELYILNGCEVMSQHDYIGKHIPIIPVYGRTINVDKRDVYRGIIRNAKDAQRIYNYATSQNIETIALSPKQPYFATPTMIEGFESQWQTMNIKNHPVLFFNPDPESGIIKPTRDAPAQQNPALIQQIMQADQDIMATVNMYEPSLGKDETDKSGKAILALQDQSTESTEEFFDNFRKSKKYTYEILVDLIPKVYDTQRIVRIIGPDNVGEDVEINAEVIDNQTGLPVKINDMTIGKYDAVVATGPQFATKKAEAVNALTRLAESNPAFGAITSDLLAKNLDFQFADELTARVRKQMIQQGLVEPTDEEKEELGIDEQAMAAAQQQQQQLQAQLMQQQILQTQLENEKLAAEVDKYAKQVQETDAKIYKMLVEAALKKYEMGMPLTEDELEAINGYSDIVENNAADSLEEVYSADIPNIPQGM